MRRCGRWMNAQRRASSMGGSPIPQLLRIQGGPLRCKLADAIGAAAVVRVDMPWEDRTLPLRGPGGAVRWSSSTILLSPAQFCSIVTPASASAACQAGIPSIISKPAVVLLAAKYACPAAARSAVSVSSGDRFRVCRQHLCDNGGDGADIAGAVGKYHGVTVLEGKRHGGLAFFTDVGPQCRVANIS